VGIFCFDFSTQPWLDTSFDVVDRIVKDVQATWNIPSVVVAIIKKDPLDLGTLIFQALESS
jgi:hypothetical protein